jgi:ubiquinone/menaquinone biosynthesis C-methylase UbiE
LDELKRLRAEYKNREQRLANKSIYSLFNIGYLFMIQQRQRDTLSLLCKLGFSNLKSQRILEVGCGRGGVLLEYLQYGIKASWLHGCDLLEDRLNDAHTILPHLPLICADGQNLPYQAQSFDIELQYTVFSSILDNRVKTNLAKEMLRTLKPSGLILWYDFWFNPTNPQAHGIRPTEIRRLFPGCQYTFRKITLAPPLARYIVPLSWGLAHLMESLQVFNSHYLAIIRPKP